MKLSLVVAGGMVATAAAAPFDLHNFRFGHPGHHYPPPERDAAAAVAGEKRMFGGGMGMMAGRKMPCPEGRGRAAGGRARWVPTPLSTLLGKIGFGRPHIEIVSEGWDASAVHGHKNKHEHEHKHKTHQAAIPAAKVGHEPVFGILPIFGDVEAKQAEWRQKLQKLKDMKVVEEEEDDDDHEHKHKHKHGKQHGKHHKHKHGKHGKGKHGKHHKHKHAKHKGNKDKHGDCPMSRMLKSWRKFTSQVSAALAELPFPLRALMITVVLGAIFQVAFAMTFLFIRLRRAGSAEARRERRRQRREARKQAKAAYKAAKKAQKEQNDKAAEAGFDVEDETLPSYAEGENDTLLARQ